jgi:hypothetical protein
MMTDAYYTECFGGSFLLFYNPKNETHLTNLNETRARKNSNFTLIKTNKTDEIDTRNNIAPFSVPRQRRQKCWVFLITFLISQKDN